MKTGLMKRLFLVSCIGAFAMIVCGCGGEDSQSEESSADTSKVDHSHGGWWCVEHGIPEEECTMCSSDAATECKEKGDWCEEHNRAESQCFICDPTRAESFSNLYEAKYGEAPPAREDE